MPPTNMPTWNTSGIQIQANSIRLLLLTSPRPSPSPRWEIGLGLWAVTYLMGHPHHPPTPSLTFGRSGWDYMVQIEALSTPECQKGIPSQGGQWWEEDSVVHHAMNQTINKTLNKTMNRTKIHEPWAKPWTINQGLTLSTNRSSLI